MEFSNILVVFPSSPFLGLTVVLFFTLATYKLAHIGRRDRRLPPGPPTLPVLGNLHQIPLTGLYKKFKEWSDVYGPVFSLKLGSDTMIVLNDRKAVHDLIDKKGAIYSDRPRNYVADLITRNNNLGFMDANTVWRAQRKIASHNLAPRVVDGAIAPIMDSEIVLLLSDLLTTPAKFSNLIKRTTASISNNVVWGHRAPTFEDFWGHNVYDALKFFSDGLELGANPPADQFPFLQWIPDRFAAWKRRGKHSGESMDAIWTEARRRADERRAKGKKRPEAILDRMLDGEVIPDVSLTDDQINHFLGVLVEGGAETSASSMLTSLMLLALHPEAQRKAQKQLDEVCGSKRTPTWSDFGSLPYINYIVKEALRWHPTVPLCPPHRVAQDDWYEGMLIPKDSSIVIPIWTIQHTESLGYASPAEYNPDRWEGYSRLASELAGIQDFENRDKSIPLLQPCFPADETSAHHYAYGAGRRICPGMHLAERMMWRITAKILWAFEIEAVDIDPTSYFEGMLHCPKPYRINLHPRSSKHIETIRRELTDASQLLAKYE